MNIVESVWGWLSMGALKFMTVTGMPQGGGGVPNEGVAPTQPTVTGAGPAASQPSSSSMVMLVVVMVVMMAILFIPQWRQNKKRTEMLGSLAVGDRVITVGGIIGRIKKIKSDVITLTIADKVDVTISRSGVHGKTEIEG